MRAIKEVTIGEIEYKITPMNPIKATKVLTRVLKIIGKPLAKLIGNSKKSAPGESLLDAELGEGLIGEAIEALVERLDEGEVERLIKELINKDYVTYSEDGEFKKLVNVDGHFGEVESGLMGMFSLVKSVLEANYSDFFGGLADLKK